MEIAEKRRRPVSETALNQPQERKTEDVMSFLFSGRSPRQEIGITATVSFERTLSMPLESTAVVT
jgi:hypothetical protein